MPDSSQLAGHLAASLGEQADSSIGIRPEYSGEASEWWHRFLVGKSRPDFEVGSTSLRILDLFSSVGGLALGAITGAMLLGRNGVIEGAADTDLDALKVHQYNLGTRRIVHESVLDMVDISLVKSRKTGGVILQDPVMLPLGSGFSNIDLLIGGPPCQGHSTLNNKTRSDDPKNKLMLAMPAVAVALNINSVVIENVPNVVNDHGNVVERTIELLTSHDYKVESGVISARQLGWPQTRKRFFIVARRDRAPFPLTEVVDQLRMPEKALEWAIGDLLDEAMEGDVFRSTPNLSKDNEHRVAWLFDNDRYDLENHMRPKCHQDGHTYPAVYGRMKWEEPAPTITGGFQTPGRGRFVHPKRRRVLTPHEAARIQGFPDWFDFASPSGDALNRTLLGKWIGDAVPSIMGAAATIAAIG